MSMDFLAIDERFTTDRTLPMLTLSQPVILGAATPIPLAVSLLTLLPVILQFRVIWRSGAFDFDMSLNG